MEQKLKDKWTNVRNNANSYPMSAALLFLPDWVRKAEAASWVRSIVDSREDELRRASQSTDKAESEHMKIYRIIQNSSATTFLYVKISAVPVMFIFSSPNIFNKKKFHLAAMTSATVNCDTDLDVV